MNPNSTSIKNKMNCGFIEEKMKIAYEGICYEFAPILLS